MIRIVVLLITLKCYGIHNWDEIKDVKIDKNMLQMIRIMVLLMTLKHYGIQNCDEVKDIIKIDKNM